MQGAAFRESHTYYGADSHQLYNELKTALFDHIIPNPRYRLISNRENSEFRYNETQQSNYVLGIHLELSYRDTNVAAANIGFGDTGVRMIRMNLNIDGDNPTRNRIDVSSQGYGLTLYFNFNINAFVEHKDLLFKAFKFFIDESQLDGNHHHGRDPLQVQSDINRYIEWFIDDYLFTWRQSNLEAFAMNRNPWAQHFLSSGIMQSMPMFGLDIPRPRPLDQRELGGYYQRYMNRQGTE